MRPRTSTSTHRQTAHKTVLKLQLEGPLIRTPLEQLSGRALKSSGVVEVLWTDIKE